MYATDAADATADTQLWTEAIV